jgi:hypothetical protein
VSSDACYALWMCSSRWLVGSLLVVAACGSSSDQHTGGQNGDASSGTTDASAPGSDGATMTADGGGATTSDSGGAPTPDSGGTTNPDSGGATTSDSGGTTTSDSGGTTTADSGSTGSAGNPDGSCTAGVPSQGQPADTSNPTTVVGTGTAASCTFSKLNAAVTLGGVITFDCGSCACKHRGHSHSEPADRQEHGHRRWKQGHARRRKRRADLELQ